MGNSYKYFRGELDSIPLQKITHEAIANARKKEILKPSQQVLDLTDDWIMYEYEGGTDRKFGRVVYSKKLDQIRGMTIGEFYGDGIVD